MFNSILIGVISLVNSVTIDYEVVNDVILMPVTINGHEGWLIVDSGAGISVIDYKIGLDIGVFRTHASGITIHGYGGAVKNLCYASVANVSVDSMRLKGRFLINDIDEILRVMERGVKGEIFGIVGGDIMSRNRFIIDYSEKQIHILGKKTNKL